jgi:hypothetical protein
MITRFIILLMSHDPITPHQIKHREQNKNIASQKIKLSIKIY